MAHSGRAFFGRRGRFLQSGRRRFAQMGPQQKIVAALLAGSLALTGCGLSSGGALPLSVGQGTGAQAITAVPELSGVPITVGGKDFTEGVVATYIAEFALAAAGMRVRDLSSLAGSNSYRVAQLSGQVDLGMDYTGTAWMSYLGNEQPIADPRQQWEAVRQADLEQNQLVWLPPTTVDNTYALAMSEATAAATGVRTLSDYAALVNRDPKAAAACLETEFAVRRDGFPGLADRYRFDAARVPVAILQTGIIYQATATGSQCRFGEVYTTDGRIKSLGLKLLVDDRKFFPNYNLAPVIRKEMLDAHPQIAEVFDTIRPLLTTDSLSDLNARVDVDGADPAEVARDFLVSHGVVSAG